MSDITFASAVIETEKPRLMAKPTKVKHVFQTSDGKYVAMAKHGGLFGPGVASAWKDETIEAVQAAMQTLLDTGHWPDGTTIPNE